MAASVESNAIDFTVTNQPGVPGDRTALLQGEVLLTTRAYSAWGGAVAARLYLPLTPDQVWQQLTDYPRWTQYFPDVTHSQVLHPGINDSNSAVWQAKRLYQSASKAFLVFTAKVEIYLKVLETHHQRVQFYLESGSFSDFFADLSLEAYENGTILTYCVQATPSIPVPRLLIEQAIRLDLPTNLRQMRRVMCS